jgi:diphthamide biosynthesis protein 4
MATSVDVYRVLGLDGKRNGKPITADELRQAYKRALLTHHPDKHAAVPSARVRLATIDDIAEAYRILGNAQLRAQYDRESKPLQSSDDLADDAVRHTGMETMDLEELDFDEDSQTWSRQCRCGSSPAFVVEEAELENHVEYGELITGCKGCSLWLKVLFSVAD